MLIGGPPIWRSPDDRRPLSHWRLPVDRSPSTHWRPLLIVALHLSTFPSVAALFHIFDALPVETATNERAFSTMNEVNQNSTLYA